jgi:hypothetical protein
MFVIKIFIKHGKLELEILLLYQSIFQHATFWKTSAQPHPSGEFTEFVYLQVFM